jgi:hypothetical protein
MKTQGHSSLLEFPLFRSNSFSRLYHILSDYFKPYNDLLSLTQYMLWPTFAFDTDISLGTFMYMSESSDLYKYAIMTFINYKDRLFCVVRDIRYQKVIPFIIREYVLLKSMSGLCVNP